MSSLTGRSLTTTSAQKNQVLYGPALMGLAQTSHPILVFIWERKTK